MGSGEAAYNGPVHHAWSNDWRGTEGCVGEVAAIEIGTVATDSRGTITALVFLSDIVETRRVLAFGRIRCCDHGCLGGGNANAEALDV